MSLRVFLIAGEMSGDRLGGALMAGLKRLVPGVTFSGIGGPMMSAQGLDSLFAMDELSVMGIAEVLPKYRALRRRIDQAAAAVLEAQPDVLITIDSPDFCLRVAKQVKEHSSIRVVHYVAPSVWAWRPGRAAKMARHVDQVLALLPFEPPYMEKAGMRCDFVGHPVVAEAQATAAECDVFRKRHGMDGANVLLVLPGSRQGEVGRLMPVFGAAVAQVMDAVPNTRVVIPAAAPVAQIIQDEIADWPGKPLVLDPREMPDSGAAEKRAAFGAADLALAASGTVSLELAASMTPMVVAYDMSWLSWQIMSRMALIDTVTLVNLVVDDHVVPEFLGPDCVPGAIADALVTLGQDLEARKRQVSAMGKTMEALGKGQEAPGLRAAQAVLEGLGVGV